MHVAVWDLRFDAISLPYRRIIGQNQGLWDNPCCCIHSIYHSLSLQGEAKNANTALVRKEFFTAVYPL